MYTWTSSRPFWVLAATLVLSGCLDIASGGVPRSVGFARNAPQTVAVANRSVVIGGPRGYCIDRGSSRLGGDTAFVLLGSCASITGNAAAAAPDFPAVLTATVTKDEGTAPATETTMQQLERYLAGPDGRAMLSRDGQADSVDIYETRRENGAILIYLRDRGLSPTPGLEDIYWRGLFQVRGRLVTASVFGLSSQPLPAETGLATLRAFVARIRQETRPAPVANAPDVAAARRKGLLRNLFK